MLCKGIKRLFSFKLPFNPLSIAISKENVLRDFLKGNELILEKKHSQAIDCFDECIKIFENIKQPNNIQYYLSKEKKAFCLLNNHSIDKCRKELEEVISLSKNYFNAYVDKAYANYVSFLSLTDIVEAHEVLNKLVQDKDLSRKGYFTTEMALMKYLIGQSSKAVDISLKIMKDYKLDRHLFAINCHNLALMTRNNSYLKKAYNVFKDRPNNHCYGLTIVELCKDKGNEIKYYFNKGLKYFEQAKNDPSAKNFFLLLAKQYEEQKMMLYTEGLYQNALSAQAHNTLIDEYNHLNIHHSYGNFLLSQKKRAQEGRFIIDDCTKKLKEFPHWYPQLSHLYYLKYDFQTKYTIISH